MTQNHNNDGPATPAKPKEVLAFEEQAKEIVRGALDLPPETEFIINPCKDPETVAAEEKIMREGRTPHQDRHDIMKNRAVLIHEYLLGEIHYRLDSGHPAPFGLDESVFMTQEEIDERARKEVNALLRHALHLDEERQWQKENCPELFAKIRAWESENLPIEVLEEIQRREKENLPAE